MLVNDVDERCDLLMASAKWKSICILCISRCFLETLHNHNNTILYMLNVIDLSASKCCAAPQPSLHSTAEILKRGSCKKQMGQPNDTGQMKEMFLPLIHCFTFTSIYIILIGNTVKCDANTSSS